MPFFFIYEISRVVARCGVVFRHLPSALQTPAALAIALQILKKASNCARNSEKSLPVLEAARLFGLERRVIRPVSPKVGAGDFAFAGGHRLAAISLLAGTLNSAAAFSIAVVSSAASGRWSAKVDWVARGRHGCDWVLIRSTTGRSAKPIPFPRITQGDIIL
jgi:hypothetical protein